MTLPRLTLRIAIPAMALMVAAASAQIGPPTPPGGDDIGPPIRPSGSGDIGPPAPPANPGSAAGSPAATIPQTSPTAEAVLEEILKQHGNGTTAATGTGKGPGTLRDPEKSFELTPDGLIREGQLIQSRSGRLKRDDTTGATIFVFDDNGVALPAMAAVPSRRLMLMEDAAGIGESRTPQDMTFPIDAEITQYRGKNFLYIRPSTTAIPKPTTAPSTMPATTATVAGVLPDPKIEAVAPHAPALIKMGEGELIEQRVGRLVKDGRTGAEIITFDGDGKKMLDQPMGLIPCKFLAVMEDASDGGSKPVKFKVSGEVTQYRGKNYLYLKSVTIIHDIHGGIGG